MKFPNWTLPILFRVLSLAGLTTAAISGTGTTDNNNNNNKASLMIGFAISSSSSSSATTIPGGNPFSNIDLELDFFVKVAEREVRFGGVPFQISSSSQQKEIKSTSPTPTPTPNPNPAQKRITYPETQTLIQDHQPSPPSPSPYTVNPQKPQLAIEAPPSPPSHNEQNQINKPNTRKRVHQKEINHSRLENERQSSNKRRKVLRRSRDRYSYGEGMGGGEEADDEGNYLGGGGGGGGGSVRDLVRRTGWRGRARRRRDGMGR